MFRFCLRSAAHAVSAVLIFSAGGAIAGGDATTLVYQGASGRVVVDVTPGAVRIDDASRQWQLYRQQSDAIFSINPVNHAYTRLDAGTASAIRSRVERLRARIDDKVSQLPQNQRATARTAMIQSIPALDASSHRVGLDRTGRTDSVAGVACEIVQVVRDGRPAETLCVASADALGISEASFDSVQSMFKLMRTMLADTGFQAAGLPYLDLSGMPVRFTDTNTGERRQLIRIAHKSLPAARFDIPDHYTAKSVTAPGS